MMIICCLLATFTVTIFTLFLFGGAIATFIFVIAIAIFIIILLSSTTITVIKENTEKDRQLKEGIRAILDLLQRGDPQLQKILDYFERLIRHTEGKR